MATQNSATFNMRVESGTAAAHPPQPIFIHGITQRSGTHYLRDLLCLHPDCKAGGPIWSNYFLQWIKLLDRYTRYTYSMWDANNWQVREKIGPPDILNRQLGNGLLAFLNLQLRNHDPDGADQAQSSNIRLVTKTPNLAKLDYFFRFFPNTPLIIIIRDGRAVAESSAKTFGRPYEITARDWDYAARKLSQFLDANHENHHKYLVVRYEDLIENTQQELVRIMQFLNLDIQRFDFTAALDLPLRGSSTIISPDNLHWSSVEKPSDFNPIARWSHWTPAQLDRFNWIAGDSLEKFGYRREKPPVNPVLSRLRNTLLDLLWIPIWRARLKLRQIKVLKNALTTDMV